MRVRQLVLFAACTFAVTPAFAVSVKVINPESVARSAEPVSGGVPFARGTVTDPRRLRLVSGQREIPAQFTTTAKWPDGSIRWVLVDTEVDLPASGSVDLTLDAGVAPAAVTGISIDDSTASLTIDTGASRFTFQKRELSVVGSTFDVNAAGRSYRAVPSSWSVEESGAMKAVIRVDGSFMSGSDVLGSDLIRFMARMTFFRNRTDIRVALTFRNRSGFNWDGGQQRGPTISLTGATFGIPLLPSGGNYRFGPGVEKTWPATIAAGGSVATTESRFNADGTLAAGYAALPPILSVSPKDYASARAFGAIALPVTGAVDRQATFDRFEKLQLAKVASSSVEPLPNAAGRTIWGHLAQDLVSWNDYGDLRWGGNGCGSLSGNHYDWVYGMYLQFMRTGDVRFANAARVFARHEIDFDIYHTGDDGAAFNFQKNWEDRSSHDSPDNCFGPGRPTHTWAQGYALHWLMTGDRRGLDAFNELQEGIRQYLYESFVNDGHVNTNEIRTQGWITDNLVARWRIDPGAVLTTPNGSKTIPQAIKDVLQDVFDREAAAGSAGFVHASPAGADESSFDTNLRAPLQNAYFVEPAIKAYDEVFRNSDPAYASSLLGLAGRVTRFLMSVTYGGDTNSIGRYRPRQIPYFLDVRQPVDGQQQGQLPYLLMAANAAGFLYGETHDTAYRDYARAAFSDYVRYFGSIPGDTYGDPQVLTPAAYNSFIFTETESKIHGWSTRYGQYYLESETSSSPPPTAPSRRRAAGHGGS